MRKAFNGNEKPSESGNETGLDITLEKEKKSAARSSLRFIREGDVVGLGSGSTATYAVEFIGDLVRQGFGIRGIPTSEQTRELARRLGIPLVTFDDVQVIDVTIDGADELDQHLQLIKGRGGALLREKVVASASRRVVIVVDSSKPVPLLGKSALPIEVITFSRPLIKAEVEAMGASVEVRQSNGVPYVTDEGHHILDCFFGRIENPSSLADKLSNTPGIVGHGLFIDIADVVLIGKGERVIEIRRGGPWPDVEASDLGNLLSP